MKHYYEKCPYNPDGWTPWLMRATECPWCLQQEVRYWERSYRRNPIDTISALEQELG